MMNLIALAIPFFFLLIGIEWVVARRMGLDIYRFNDAIQLKRSGNRLFALAEKGSASGIDLVNHSCRPNARIERGIVMVASRRIEAGEEITFDYRTTDLVPEGIRCWCPEPKCVI